MQGIKISALAFFRLEEQQADRLRKLAKWGEDGGSNESGRTFRLELASGEQSSQYCLGHAAVFLVEKGHAVFTRQDGSHRFDLHAKAFSAVVVPRDFEHGWFGMEQGTEIVGVIGDEYVRAILAPAEPIHK
jgi:hypothetical protein